MFELVISLNQKGKERLIDWQFRQQIELRQANDELEKLFAVGREKDVEVSKVGDDLKSVDHAPHLTDR